MAKDGRTEEATPRRRKEAREKGNVPQSKEMALFFNLIAFTLFVAFFGSWFVKSIMDLQREALDMVQAEMNLFAYAHWLANQTLKVLIPVAGLALAFIFLNYMMQVRFLFATKAVKPDIQKINPKNFFSNLFKRKTIVQILKQLILVTILGYIVYLVFFNRVDEIASSMRKPWIESLTIMWEIFKEVIYKILFAMLIIGLLDHYYQKWEHSEDLKMKKDEVKRDRKDTDGDPEVKFRQNQRRIAILKNQIHKTMKEEVTFIATNPTHYAVGIHFKPGKGNPKVMIKGIDHMALYMKEMAKKYDVPIYEDPPLARELYNRVVENEEIPDDMWAALALVIRKLMKEQQIKF